jgi:hypothetical protein
MIGGSTARIRTKRFPSLLTTWRHWMLPARPLSFFCPHPTCHGAFGLLSLFRSVRVPPFSLMVPKPHYSETSFFLFCNRGIWTQGFTLAGALPLSHAPSSVCFILFFREHLMLFVWGWPKNFDPLISASYLAGIISMTHCILPFFCFFEAESHITTQDGLEFSVLLPQPPKCWDYRCVSPQLIEIPFLKKEKMCLFAQHIRKSEDLHRYYCSYG